ncbi:hypothetical protein BC827DRAFT_1144959, partial [Russula dissimulans]
AKCKVLTEFCQGIINILCATEAVGMGMDIPDIEHVVQFAVLTSLSVLNQRVGCAGHSGQHTLAIILVEPSVFQTKKMEAGIQAWCLAEGCRVEVSDQYFNNPLRLNDISTFLMPLGVTH